VFFHPKHSQVEYVSVETQNKKGVYFIRIRLVNADKIIFCNTNKPETMTEKHRNCMM